MKLFSTLIAVFLVAGCVWAQAKAEPTPTDPAAVTSLLEAIEDIRMIDVLAKLRLTKEQIDKIAPILDSAQKSVKELQAQEGRDLLAMREDVAAQRKKSLEGTEASEEFYKRLKGVQAAAFNRRSETRTRVIKDAAGKIKPVLDDRQRQHIQTESKKAIEEAKIPGGKNASEDQVFWYYVEHVLLSARTPVLLREMAKTAPAAVPPSPANP